MVEESIIPNKIPEKIWRKGDLEDIILYTLNAFGPLPRTEFINTDKIKNRMNKNTFHLHAKRLKNVGYINCEKEGKNSIYKILSKGISELARRLYDYELDLDTLLKIEQEKAKNILSKLNQFFRSNKVEDVELKKEILELSSIITIDRLKDIFSDEDNFNKLILFLALNHPRFYPDYSISMKEFIKNYNSFSKNKLTRPDIEIFIQKVVDERIYEIHFHKLQLEDKEIQLFFTENSDYGKIFQLIVDSELKNLVLLKNLGVIELNNKDLVDKYIEIAKNLVYQYKLFHSDLIFPLISLIDNFRKKIKEELVKKSIVEIKDYMIFRELPEVHELSKESITPELYKIPKESLKSKDNLIKGIKTKVAQFVPRKEEKEEDKGAELKLYIKSFSNIEFRSKENLIKKAWDLYDEKDFDGTLKIIDQILEIEQTPEMYYWKAEILGYNPNLKRYKEAIEAINAGINLNPISGGYNLFRLKAEILINDEKLEEALNAIGKALEIDSQQQILERKVYILIRLNRLKETKDFVEKFQVYSSEHFSAILQSYARNSERNKNTEKALEQINLAIDLFPDALSNLAVKSFILNDLENKYEVTKLLNLLIPQINELIPDDQIRIVHILYKLGNINEANKITEDLALRINEFDPLNQVDVAELLINLERYDDSLKILDNVMKQDSAESSYYAYEVKIKIYEKVKSPEEVLKLYDEAIKDYFWFEIDKGVYLSRLKRYQEAIEIFEKAGESGYPVNIEKAQAYFESELYTLALESINSAIKEAKKVDSNIIKLKIDVLTTIGDYKEILNFYNLYKNDFEYTDYQYVCEKLIYNGQPVIAKEIFKDGIELHDPNFESDFASEFYSQFYNGIIEKIRNKDYLKALEIVKIFSEFDDKDAQLFKYHILILNNLERYQEALDVVNKAIQLWPKYPKENETRWNLIGKDSVSKGDKKVFKYYYEFCRLKASILIYMERYKESLDILNKIITVNPNISEVYLLKAINEFELGDNNTIPSIDKAIEIEPKKAINYYIKAKILYKQGRYKDGFEIINKAIELDNNSPNFYDLKTRIMLFSNKYGDLTLKTINEAIARFPKEPSLYETKSLVLGNDDKKALDALEKTEELGGSVSYYNKAQLLENSKRFDEALIAIDKEIEKNPEQAIAYNLKAIILAQLDRLDEAFEIFDKINIIKPDFLEHSSLKQQLLDMQAISLAKKGKKQESITTIKKAIEFEPDWADYYESYGKILMIFKDYKEAAIQLEKAKKLPIPQIETYIKLGECYIELGEYDKALENLIQGKYSAENSVIKVIRHDDSTIENKKEPQIELIKQAERLIKEIEIKKNNKIK